jgi:hypothetical protein
MAEFGNYSALNFAYADSVSAETQLGFIASFISWLKNDGAADVDVAFDTPSSAASVANKPIRVKAGETLTNLPFRTRGIAAKSVGAAGNLRVIGHY